MQQLIVTNNVGEKHYLYKQSTVTSNKGKVTMHFFSKKQGFSPDTVRPANAVPRGYTIHEDPFTHRITCPPISELLKMLKSVYREQL